MLQTLQALVLVNHLTNKPKGYSLVFYITWIGVLILSIFFGLLYTSNKLDISYTNYSTTSLFQVLHKSILW